MLIPVLSTLIAFHLIILLYAAAYLLNFEWYGYVTFM